MEYNVFLGLYFYISSLIDEGLDYKDFRFLM